MNASETACIKYSEIARQPIAGWLCCVIQMQSDCFPVWWINSGRIYSDYVMRMRYAPSFCFLSFIQNDHRLSSLFYRWLEWFALGQTRWESKVWEYPIEAQVHQTVSLSAQTVNGEGVWGWVAPSIKPEYLGCSAVYFPRYNSLNNLFWLKLNQWTQGKL